MPQQQLPSEKIVSRRSFLQQTLTLPGAITWKLLSPESILVGHAIFT